MKTKLIYTLAAALVALAPAVRANWNNPSSTAIAIAVSDDDDEKSQREQERKDRERERADAKIEKEEDLYDSGTDALDDHDWRRAAASFRKVAEMRMQHADAALYWLAYAQGKMGARSEGLSTLLQLQKSYPKSKWVEDGKTLEVEIRQSAGQQIEPEHVEDEDVKLMAINGLMNSDPERAIPILEGILNGHQPVKLKERALFVLTQSGSQRAFDIVVRTAKSGPPDLRERAVRTLGILGGERSRGVLSDIYNATTDINVKKSVLKSYMISGDRTRLLALAKGESNAELRQDAVMQLGVIGARNELTELYGSEPSVEVRKKILQAMFIGGNSEKLGEIARNEKVLELKVTAIRNLGLLGGGRSGELLLSLYNNDPRPEVRNGVIEALFIQGNAKTLISLARAEKDPQAKRRIVEKLSVMGSKDATDYLMEFLK
ncbi:MAG TPA: HEAT repeat domain-containing protein [Thermoanaerobaculia bacterium]|jgi:HEAT repeat protein|nr:HEAT repeat domain-containing protein [Thermoanaerobaculia bacterium]